MVARHWGLLMSRRYCLVKRHLDMDVLLDPDGQTIPTENNEEKLIQTRNTR
jgi:hypothetical protein